MAVDIQIPPVGESITEGTLARWLKSEGDRVQEGEPLFELETDKATGEVPAPASGALHIKVKEGETVQVGTVVGAIDGAAKEAAKPAGKPKPAAAAKEEKEQEKEEEASAKEEAPPKAPSKPAKDELKADKAKPAAAPKEKKEEEKKEEEEEEEKEVSGKEEPAPKAPGKPAKDESTAAKAKPPAAPARPEPAPPPTPLSPPWQGGETGGAPSPPVPTDGRETRKPMTRIRKTIAERLVHAQHTAAILTTFSEADMTQVIAIREQLKEPFRERHGVSLGFMSFFIKASVQALKEFSVVNAWIDGDQVVYHDYYDIGVAVSTDRGLMVPVIRGANDLSFAAIEKAIEKYAQKAREGRITVDDLRGGTFTITNGGVFGSLLSTPILNPPQSAILGMHAIQKRPVVVGDKIEIRPMMYLALSYDHRLIDGREAVLFLKRVKECVESPHMLLLGLV